MEMQDRHSKVVGSAMLAINTRYIEGSANTGPVVLAALLVKYIDYAQARYDAGNEEYYPVLDTLKKKLANMRCREICNHITVRPPSTTPIIVLGLYAKTYEDVYE